MRLRRWFKKYFIPHSGNDHRPHFLRPRSRLFVLFSILGLEIILMASTLLVTRTNLLGDILTNVLVGETNAHRAEAQVGLLKENSILVKAAQAKANDMAAKGYFAHVTPDGKTPWYWLDQAGYEFTSAGENLAVNFIDSTDVTEAWMNSPGHRENILSPRYTEIGIATARGAFQGKETVFVVQFFGRPATSEIAATAAPVKVAEGSTPKQQDYVAVKGSEIETPITGSTEKADASAPLQNIIASPRRTVNGLGYILLAIIMGALILTVFVEIRIQHAAPIMSGLLLIAILSGVIFVNHMLASIIAVL